MAALVGISGKRKGNGRSGYVDVQTHAEKISPSSRAISGCWPPDAARDYGLFALSVYNHGRGSWSRNWPAWNGMAVVTQDRGCSGPPRTADVRRGHGGPTDPSVSLDRGQAGVSRAVGQHGGPRSPLVTLDLSCRLNGYFFSGSKEADQAWVQMPGPMCDPEPGSKGRWRPGRFIGTPDYQDILTGDILTPGPSSDGWPAAG